jgi:hypothetical protein
MAVSKEQRLGGQTRRPRLIIDTTTTATRVRFSAHPMKHSRVVASRTRFISEAAANTHVRGRSRWNLRKTVMIGWLRMASLLAAPIEIEFRPTWPSLSGERRDDRQRRRDRCTRMFVAVIAVVVSRARRRFVAATERFRSPLSAHSFSPPTSTRAAPRRAATALRGRTGSARDVASRTRTSGEHTRQVYARMHPRLCTRAACRCTYENHCLDHWTNPC